MAENIFSSYTNTVREIFTETDKGIANTSSMVTLRRFGIHMTTGMAV